MSDQVRQLARATIWWSGTTALLCVLAVTARLFDVDATWPVVILVLVLSAVITAALAVNLLLTPLASRDER